MMSATPDSHDDDIQQAFRAHVSATLALVFDPSVAFVADGNVHTASPLGDEKPNKFWYRIYLVPYVRAYFGHFLIDGGATSGREWVPAAIEALSPEDRALLAEQTQAARQEDARRRQELAASRRAEVHSEYLAAAPVAAAGDHGYLARKGIDDPPRDWKLVQHSFPRDAKQPFTGKIVKRRGQAEPALMIPLRAVAERRLASAEYIAADGLKDSAYGIPLRGTCYTFGAYAPARPIYLCEGVATAYTVHRLTHSMTLRCGSAVALKQVAKDVRKEYGAVAQIVVCAERGNGHAQAVDAAAECAGVLCEPPWAEDDTGTDFDDYCRAYGDEAARDALGNFTGPAAAPLTDGTATSAQLEWMRLANEEFFVVEEWGKDRRVLGCEDADGIVAVDERALRVGLASRRVPGVSTKPHTFWLNHPARRQYRRVAYDPEWKTLDRDKDLNLWRGFAVEPKAGDWSLLRTHILDNIAGGNEEIYRHVIGLLADIVQHPGTPSGVALVLQGEEGVGKGMLANAMLKLFGRHGYRSSNPKSLSGEFSGHRESLSLFYADEMSWAGDKTLREQLWGLITEALQEIHPKHRTPYMAPNFLHFILTTNKEHAATIHTGNRRIFLLEVRDQWDHLYGEEKKAARDAYFARLYHQLYEEGGLEAMLHDLLLHDLSGFNVRVFPTTAAMTHNVALSMTSLDRWLLMLLRDGWEDGKQEDKALLYRRYTEAARDMGDKYPAHDVTFWKRLRKVLGGLREERSRGNERKRMVILPALNTARKHAARVLGVPINADE